MHILYIKCFNTLHYFPWNHLFIHSFFCRYGKECNCYMGSIHLHSSIKRKEHVKWMHIRIGKSANDNNNECIAVSEIGISLDHCIACNRIIYIHSCIVFAFDISIVSISFRFWPFSAAAYWVRGWGLSSSFAKETLNWNWTTHELWCIYGKQTDSTKNHWTSIFVWIIPSYIYNRYRGYALFVGNQTCRISFSCCFSCCPHIKMKIYFNLVFVFYFLRTHTQRLLCAFMFNSRLNVESMCDVVCTI